MTAFIAALAVGAAVNNPTVTVLWRGILIMLVAWPVGWALGAVAQKVNQQSIDKYKAQHPIAADSSDPSPSAQDADAAVHEERKPASTRVA